MMWRPRIREGTPYKEEEEKPWTPKQQRGQDEGVGELGGYFGDFLVSKDSRWKTL